MFGLNRLMESRVAVPLLVAVLVGGLTGCGDLLEVKNPGAIVDEDLDSPDMMEIVAAGVSAEFSDELDNGSFLVARLTDEIAGSGSYFSTGQYRRGIIERDDTNGRWEQPHEAVWAADQALDRFFEVLGEDAAHQRPFTSRTYLFQGLAHRILGENFCQVAYEAGPAEPKSVAFERAVASLNQAIDAAGTAGEGADEFATAAHGGLAQAYVGLGDWDQAVQYAGMVPTGFVYEAIYHPGENSNIVWNETHGRPEVSALGTLTASYDPQDPRAPFTVCGVYEDPDDPDEGVLATDAGCSFHQGADGLTPHLRQEKYDEQGSDVPVVKGTEMRLIEAEAALRDGDVSTAVGKINEVRTYHGLDPIDEADVVATGETTPSMTDDWTSMRDWDVLDRERYLTLWLEGRRLWDLHRWDHPFLQGGSVVYPGIDERASCLPIAESECNRNENLDCA